MILFEPILQNTQIEDGILCPFASKTPPKYKKVSKGNDQAYSILLFFFRYTTRKACPVESRLVFYAV